MIEVLKLYKGFTKLYTDELFVKINKNFKGTKDHTLKLEKRGRERDNRTWGLFFSRTDWQDVGPTIRTNNSHQLFDNVLRRKQVKKYANLK